MVSGSILHHQTSGGSLINQNCVKVLELALKLSLSRHMFAYEE